MKELTKVFLMVESMVEVLVGSMARKTGYKLVDMLAETMVAVMAETKESRRVDE